MTSRPPRPHMHRRSAVSGCMTPAYGTIRALNRQVRHPRCKDGGSRHTLKLRRPSIIAQGSERTRKSVGTNTRVRLFATQSNKAPGCGARASSRWCREDADERGAQAASNASRTHEAAELRCCTLLPLRLRSSKRRVNIDRRWRAGHHSRSGRHLAITGNLISGRQRLRVRRLLGLCVRPPCHHTAAYSSCTAVYVRASKHFQEHEQYTSPQSKGP